MDGFDLVLGVKWLQTLGPILWDFVSLTMSFGSGGSPITLQGQQTPNGTRVHLLKEQTEPCSQLDQLLDEFNDLFQEPTGLPPLRNCDHHICLQPGSGPKVVQPCRYPHLQKGKIEKQCEQMLKQGSIRPSRSPFSSPVLLVRKHDGTWHFCVDYKKLNAITVKDKFPITVVEELLEVLHQAGSSVGLPSSPHGST